MKIEIKLLNPHFYTHAHISTDGGDYWETKYKDLPEYATPGSAAMDLVCTRDVTICPGDTVDIHTGLAIWVGSGISDHYLLYEQQSNEGPYDTAEWLGFTGLILPRSGLGSQGLVLANTIGVIDEDYQGELVVKARNRNPQYVENWSYGNDNQFTKNLENICLKAGDRFAQLMFVPVIKAQWNIVDEFSSKTDRGTGGFGSTGSNVMG